MPRLTSPGRTLCQALGAVQLPAWLLGLGSGCVPVKRESVCLAGLPTDPTLRFNEWWEQTPEATGRMTIRAPSHQKTQASTCSARTGEHQAVTTACSRVRPLGCQQQRCSHEAR